jgi:hypothetical protein
MKKDEGWSGPESDQQFPQSHDLRRIERYTLGVSSDCLHGGVDAWGRVRKKVLAGHIEVELERYCEFLPAVGESTNPIIRGAPWIPISI